jgi:hypothetical protein
VVLRFTTTILHRPPLSTLHPTGPDYLPSWVGHSNDILQILYILYVYYCTFVRLHAASLQLSFPAVRSQTVEAVESSLVSDNPEMEVRRNKVYVFLFTPT